MASSACHKNCPRITVLLMFILPLSFLLSTSAGKILLEGNIEDVRQRKMVLGSRPPQCVNRCLSCRPCMAVLVTPPHHKNGLRASSLSSSLSSSSSSKGDESYYPLSWKCKCGNKYFQP